MEIFQSWGKSWWWNSVYKKIKQTKKKQTNLKLSEYDPATETNTTLSLRSIFSICYSLFNSCYNLHITDKNLWLKPKPFVYNIVYLSFLRIQQTLCVYLHTVNNSTWILYMKLSFWLTTKEWKTFSFGNIIVYQKYLHSPYESFWNEFLLCHYVGSQCQKQILVVW